jgi:hypothetical protein
MNGTLDPISFDALGSILGENDVLSFYNPSINLSTTGNLGIPVNFTMNMGTSNSKTGQSRSLTNTTFSLNPATSPSVPITNTKTFDKDNGTAELFKINPDQITMGYSFETDKNSLKNHFIAKNSQMTMNYNMEIPLQFGGDLHLGMGTTMESPIGDLSIMADQENLSIGLTLNVKNRIPLALKLKLTALDEDSVALFTTESDTIQAAGPIDPITGFATGFTLTNTDLTLTPAQIDQLQLTKKFRVSFVVTSNNQASFVTVQPSDYLEIKIGAQIEGGVLLDLDNLPAN